jgi:hypothetical protein
MKAYSLPKLNPNQYVIKAYVTYSGARQTPKFFNLRVERESRVKSPPFGFFLQYLHMAKIVAHNISKSM